MSRTVRDSFECQGEDDHNHNGAASAADVVSKQPSRHVKIGDTEAHHALTAVAAPLLNAAKEIEEHGSKYRLASPQTGRPRTRSTDSFELDLHSPTVYVAKTS